MNSGNTQIFGSGTTLTVKPREYGTHPNPSLCFITNQIDSSLEGFDSKERKSEVSGATQTLY